MKKRKLPLHFTPQVEVSGFNIIVKTGCFGVRSKKTGSYTVEYEFRGELSLHCAARLVKELRKALRKVRDIETINLNWHVTDAERPDL
jgi:hypothetical protein